MNDCYLSLLLNFRALLSIDSGANLVNSKQAIGVILPDLSLLGYAVPVESFGIGLFIVLFAYLAVEYNVQLLSHEKLKIAMNMLHTTYTPLILLRNQLEELKTGNLPESLSQQVEEALGYTEYIIYCNQNIVTLNKVNKKILPKTSTANLELSSYITSIVNQCRPYADSRRIQLTVSECSDCVSCRINENIMTAALQHLISKLILGSDLGCCISINITHTTDSWQLQITNCEIADKRVGKMFPFIPVIFPIYGYSDLWTVRKIIRLHGGKINGYRHGKSFAFQIVIPTDCHCRNQECSAIKHSSTNTKNKAKKSSESDKDDTPNAKTKDTSHILLVMADGAFRNYLKKALSRYFQISALEDPDLLKDTVVRQNPDAIIIDDNVNGTNGDTLSFRIKTDKMIGYIPVVLLIRAFDNESYLSHLGSGADRLELRTESICRLRANIRMLVENRMVLRERVKLFLSDAVFPMVPTKEEMETENTDQIFMDKVNKILEKNISTDKYTIENNQIRQTFNLYGTYDNTFANAHSVKVIVGGNYDYKYFKKLGMKRNGLLSESLDDFNLAKGDDISITGGQEEYAILGFFYRLNYGYKDRYLFEASGRYDGSSRFRRGHRFGFFPSFSAGWRVSEEAFFTQAKNYVSNLKLRLSYGSLGNQKTVGYYDYLQLINTGAVMNYAFGDTTKGDYAYESAPNSTDLTWETVITKNIGLDLGFLNNRLNVSFDAYIRDTKDMLMAGKTLPGVYGASSPRMNVADLRTKGWEASITWGDSFTLASKPFNYRIMAGIGDNTSKVTKYDNPNRTLTDPYEGQQLGEIWGYVVDGYFKTDEEARNYKVDQSFVNQMINASALDNGLHAGDLKFVDLDGNNKIEQTTSANDRKDMKVIGNSLPRYNYNFGISADWYGIDFSVLFQGIGKQNWYPGAETSMFWGPYSRPYASFIPSDFMSQVWSEENTDAYFPRPRGYVALGSNRELAVVNTKYLQNLAYCRLKNLSIGYTLPDKWLSKIGFEKIRVYFSGENLLTFTKLHSDYIDPEQASASNSWKTSKSDANIYPWAKTYSFGVDITF